MVLYAERARKELASILWQDNAVFRQTVRDGLAAMVADPSIDVTTDDVAALPAAGGQAGCLGLFQSPLFLLSSSSLGSKVGQPDGLERHSRHGH